MDINKRIAWNKGIPLSEETKKKIAETKKKNNTYQKMSQIMRGRKFSKEHLKKLSDSHKNYKHTIQQKRKISEKSKKMWANPKFKKRMIKIFNSKEHRQKLSMALKGKKSWNSGTKGICKPNSSSFKKGEKRQLGMKHTEETKEKLRQYVGEKASNWQGGKSFEPYTYDFSKRFKKAIKKRDSCCLLCNISLEDLKSLKRQIHIHHIDYDKTNSFPQNCVTLCIKCHGLTHYNRDKWKTFFQSLLKERYNYQYTEEQKIIIDFYKGK